MAASVAIREWTAMDRESVIDLIVAIQRDEFGISITREDQPDLNAVDQVYQKNGGNFWVAFSGADIVGSVGLIYFENRSVALRKMFVHASFRGKEAGTAQQLLDKAVGWCRDKNIENIYLGTIEVFRSAHRFYERNGFARVEKNELPEAFPKMPVDTIFYHLKTEA